MKYCISGTEYNAHDGIDGLIRNAKACNVRSVELWYPKNTDQLGVEATLAKLKENHLQVACVSTGSELYRNGGSLPDQQLLLEAIRLAYTTGAPLVNTYFGYSAVRDDRKAIDTYKKMLAPCLELAASLHVVICLENEFNAFKADPSRSDITRYPEVLNQLLIEVGSPNFKLTFDPANFYCAGVEPWPYAYERLKHHIAYIHVKDVYRCFESTIRNDAWHIFSDYENEYQTCPLGQGAVNWPALLQKFSEDDYQGYLCLEPHAVPDHLDASWKQSIRFVNSERKKVMPGGRDRSKPGMLHHIKLNITDLDRSLQFYCDQLRMKEICRYHLDNGGAIVQLSYNGLPPGLELWYEQPALPVENQSLHFAFEVADLPATVSQLRSNDVRIIREPFQMGHEHIAFIEDPDGYQIELYHDTNVELNS